MPPRIGSLCTGIGGLDAAVATVLGGELVWTADNDPAAAHVLDTRHPDVPNLGDIRSTPWEATAPVDILTAGFPCQPISNAGLRRGVADERWLWPYVADAVRRLRPGLVYLENAGLRTRGLDVVAADLATCGYDMRWYSIRASDIGAAHKRLRIFVAAVPAQDPDKPTGYQRRKPTAGKTQGWRTWADLGRRSRAPSTHATCQRWRQGSTTPARQQRRPHHAINSDPDWQQFAPAIRRWEYLTGHPAPPPTAPTGRGGAWRLSPRFVEWLMGYPPGYITDVDGLGRVALLRLLGNSVVPAQAEAALRLLLDGSRWPEVPTP